MEKLLKGILQRKLLKMSKFLCAVLAVITPLSFALGGTKQSYEQLLTINPLYPPQILPSPSTFNHVIQGYELLEVKRIASSATARQRELAAKDAKTNNVSFFSDAISQFDINHLPATKALFNQVYLIQELESEKFKDYFSRERPYISDSTIRPCVATKESANYTSYPSGHATMGFAMGLILAKLIPEKSEIIMNRANLYAENRLICGLHYRSDIIAGQVLGSLIAVQLGQNDKFQDMLKDAKEELRRSGLTQ